MNIAFTYDQLLKCGGTRIAFEYCRELKNQGHIGEIYCTWISPDIEDWIEKYQVRPRLLRDFVSADVVISCWWMQIDEVLKLPATKHFHFVQGRDKLSYADGHAWRDQNDVAMHRTDIEYLAVSAWAGESCRTPKIVPNGVDAEFWRSAFFGRMVPPEMFTILLEASTMDVYKGLPEALQVVERIKSMNPTKNIQCWLVTQSEISLGIVNRVILKPNDVQILNAYQNADVLIKATHFDGFGLPHLEAMSCGLPLVTTDAGGNMTFCKHDTNCLVSKVGDIDTMISNVQSLINSKALRERLSLGGVMTAKKYTWKDSVEKLLAAVN